MKKQKNYKMPNWAIQRIKAIADAYEVTLTEALLRCLDQGSKWHRRHIQKEINPAFNWEEPKPGVVIEEYNPNEEKIDEKTIKIAKAKWIDDDYF